MPNLHAGLDVRDVPNTQGDPSLTGQEASPWKQPLCLQGKTKENKISPHVMLHFNLSHPPQTDLTASCLHRCRDRQHETEHIRLDPVAQQREGCCHVAAHTLVGVDVSRGEEHVTGRIRNTDRKSIGQNEPLHTTSVRPERSIITRPQHLCWKCRLSPKYPKNKGLHSFQSCHRSQQWPRQRAAADD